MKTFLPFLIASIVLAVNSGNILSRGMRRNLNGTWVAIPNFEEYIKEH